MRDLLSYGSSPFGAPERSKLYSLETWNSISMATPDNPRKCKVTLATELFEREAHVEKGNKAKTNLPIDDIEFRRLYADQTVTQWCQWASVVGFIPLQIIDVLSISAVQAKMVHSLCQIYGKDFEHEALSSILSGLIGGSVTGLVSQSLVGSLIRNIPVVGGTMSILTLPAVSYATTYAVGAVFIRHFEKNLSMSELSFDEIEDFFIEQFKKGKVLYKNRKASA